MVYIIMNYALVIMNYFVHAEHLFQDTIDDETVTRITGVCLQQYWCQLEEQRR